MKRVTASRQEVVEGAITWHLDVSITVQPRKGRNDATYLVETPEQQSAHPEATAGAETAPQRAKAATE